MQMMGALRKKWGPKPRLVRWIYTAIVRPRLSYAAMTWSHSIIKKTKLRKLTQINRLASINDDGSSKKIHTNKSSRTHKLLNAPRHISPLSELTSL